MFAILCGKRSSAERWLYRRELKGQVRANMHTGLGLLAHPPLTNAHTHTEEIRIVEFARTYAHTEDLVWEGKCTQR